MPENYIEHTLEDAAVIGKLYDAAMEQVDKELPEDVQRGMACITAVNFILHELLSDVEDEEQ